MSIEEMISNGTFSIPYIQAKLRVSADQAKKMLAEYGIELRHNENDSKLCQGAWKKRRQKRILKNKILKAENDQILSGRNNQ